ncbi:hypothetical protein KOW79_015033 [Hemibagrus wyckioides]|uniref:Uncharacterized protein n=1 Tax=Hemibagrus wyckioides TaxID=337641 RepID=A0A9D3SFS8_9TELE|nr:hypothetical protein KOW79_015033 [Hemibagrus wyckioides]
MWRRGRCGGGGGVEVRRRGRCGGEGGVEEGEMWRRGRCGGAEEKEVRRRGRQQDDDQCALNAISDERHEDFCSEKSIASMDL